MGLKRRVRRNTERIYKSIARGERMRRQRGLLPFLNFVMLMPYMTKETIEALPSLPCPATFCKKPIAQDLQQVSFGTLTRLQGAVVEGDFIKTCIALVSVLTGEEEAVVAASPARDVLGIVNMVQREMERIGKLFQSLNGEKTPEEQGAGIDRLNFGAFGIVDWYAQRMGIIDHEDVFATPWARIFQCMKIDHENNEFEKRYRKILERRSMKK